MAKNSDGILKKIGIGVGAILCTAVLAVAGHCMATRDNVADLFTSGTRQEEVLPDDDTVIEDGAGTETDGTQTETPDVEENIGG